MEELTGTKNRRTSVKAYAIRACASAGGANDVISTWRSSLRCENFGSPEFLNFSSYEKNPSNINKYRNITATNAFK